MTEPPSPRRRRRNRGRPGGTSPSPAAGATSAIMGYLAPFMKDPAKFMGEKDALELEKALGEIKAEVPQRGGRPVPVARQHPGRGSAKARSRRRRATSRPRRRATTAANRRCASSWPRSASGSGPRRPSASSRTRSRRPLGARRPARPAEPPDLDRPREGEGRLRRLRQERFLGRPHPLRHPRSGSTS
ncbi:MAG: hypothetical protein MZU95_07250 [Desulfomicrobium escambiense]|nr:hypothetical protein [Desulfomicrobium escambiense]